MALAGMTQEQTKQHNWEHCKQIAEELEAYADGRVHRCPDCNEIIHLPDDVGDKYKCPACGTVHDLGDLEQLGMHDYMEDILDIDYIVNYRKEYKACRILVAFGGPNIYIDTFKGCVDLYWWTDRASFDLTPDAINAIDDWAEEYWNCL